MIRTVLRSFKLNFTRYRWPKNPTSIKEITDHYATNPYEINFSVKKTKKWWQIT